MTAEQKKAKELVEIFLQYVDCGGNRYTTKVQIENAKQCALKCVYEIEEVAFPMYTTDDKEVCYYHKEFWQTVRNEIINYK